MNGDGGGTIAKGIRTNSGWENTLGELVLDKHDARKKIEIQFFNIRPRLHRVFAFSICWQCLQHFENGQYRSHGR